MFVVLDMTQDGKKINRLIHELLYGTLPPNFVLLICRNKHLRPICIECNTTISKKMMVSGIPLPFPRCSPLILPIPPTGCYTKLVFLLPVLFQPILLLKILIFFFFRHEVNESP